MNLSAPFLRVVTDPATGKASVRVGSQLFPVFQLEADGRPDDPNSTYDVKASRWVCMCGAICMFGLALLMVWC